MIASISLLKMQAFVLLHGTFQWLSISFRATAKVLTIAYQTLQHMPTHPTTHTLFWPYVPSLISLEQFPVPPQTHQTHSDPRTLTQTALPTCNTFAPRKPFSFAHLTHSNIPLLGRPFLTSLFKTTISTFSHSLPSYPAILLFISYSMFASKVFHHLLGFFSVPSHKNISSVRAGIFFYIGC